MGLLKCSFQLILYTLLFTAAILFLPWLPPDVDLQPLIVPPRQKLEGIFAPNSILDKAEPMETDRQLGGPESIAIRKDEIFSGLETGEIVKLKNGKVTTIVNFEKEICGSLLDNPKCRSRPLGIRFDKSGKLLVADAFLGILRVDVDKGTFDIVVPMTAEIVGGKPPKFPDDLDVDKEGYIYWSDISEYADYGDLAMFFLGPASGRLLKYDPKTKKNTILIEKLQSANGVQLSENEDFVTVTETFAQRVWKYHLKGAKKGQKEIFVDNLPGLPDNIRPNGKGGFYISLFLSREETNECPNFVEIATSSVFARRFTLRVQHLLLSLISLIDSLFPNDIFEDAKKYVGSLGSLLSAAFSPTGVIIVEVDENGKILGTLQSKMGKMNFISETDVGETYTYFGSPFGSQIWRIRNNLLQDKVQ